MEPRFRAPSLATDSKGFVSDADRDKVFHALRTQPENRLCFDCAGRNNTWISATFGIFLCMTCSGQHRNLGARISFVRSTDLDRIKLDELVRMELGGNARARTFFRSHGIPEGRPTDYRAKACERYRKALDKELTEILERFRPDLTSPWRCRSPLAMPASNIEIANEEGSTDEGIKRLPNEASQTLAHDADASGATENAVGHENPAESVLKKAETEIQYVIDKRSSTDPSGGGHFQASAPTGRPAMKVQTDDFDFDFDSAFQSAGQTQSKIHAKQLPAVKKSLEGNALHSSVPLQASHGQQSSTLTSSVPLPGPGRSVTKDFSTAKAISAQDFERGDEGTAASSDFSRFKSANAISSDAFFGTGCEGKMSLEDEAATRLGIYHDKAVQKATDFAVAAHETFKNAAGWFNRVAQSNSGSF